MRYGVLWQLNRKLTRGAAVLLVGGLAAGCSSQVDRFSDGLFTGTTSSGNQRVASAAAQPYPGDNVDGTYTGSVRSPVGRPDVGVGGGSLPMNSSGQTVIAPLPAPSTPGRVATGAVSPIESTPLAPPSAAQQAPISSSNDSYQPRNAAPASNSRSSDSGSQKVTVRSGDTVYGLARRYDVPASAILAANGLQEGSGLRAGQSLLIPRYAYSVEAPSSGSKVASAEPVDRSPKPEPQPAEKAVMPQSSRSEEPTRSDDGAGEPASSSGGSYTVASGDTLYGISAKTGVSVARLKQANNLSNGYLSVGQTLVVPTGGTSEPVKTAKKEQERAKPDAGSASKSDTAAAPVEEKKVASYTPPKSDSVAKQANDNDKVAAAPDSTGIGKLRWPVRGRVVSAFRPGSTADGDGIDIAVPEGTPVKAAENGVVIYAGDGLKEFGKTVLLRHEDGLVTVYGYTSDIKVARGDSVRRGQEIALSGMSGSADRPKLHFEVRKDATPVDPKTYLD